MVRKEKTHLFDDFSRSLKSFINHPNPPEIFLCPLCHRVFARTEMDKLSRAHIVPKSIGGSSTTLTCKQCNDSMGAKADYAPAQYDALLQSFKGVSSYRWVLNIGQQTVRANLSVSGTRWTAIIPKPLNRYQREQISGPAIDESSGVRINLSTRIPKNSAYAQSLLHSAYLHLFHEFGYEYVFTRSGALLRRLATRRHRQSKITPGHITLDLTDDQYNHCSDTTAIVHSELGVFFGVFYPRISAATGPRVILVPGLSRESCLSFVQLVQPRDPTKIEATFNLICRRGREPIAVLQHTEPLRNLWTVKSEQGVWAWLLDQA